MKIESIESLQISRGRRFVMKAKIEIPTGWKPVKSGRIKAGDRILGGSGCPEWLASSGEDDDTPSCEGMPVLNFMVVIRPTGKGKK